MAKKYYAASNLLTTRMSALGQKRTCAALNVMSALPPKTTSNATRQGGRKTVAGVLPKTAASPPPLLNVFSQSAGDLVRADVLGRFYQFLRGLLFLLHATRSPP